MIERLGRNTVTERISYKEVMLEVLRDKLNSQRESRDFSWKTINFAREAFRSLRYKLVPCSGRLHAPMSGDAILTQTLAQLIKRAGIELVIETGTNVGSSAGLLASISPRVITIENNPYFVKAARDNLNGFQNIRVIHGGSAESLSRILPTESARTLFFLDAHWGHYWPILDELKAIGSVPAFSNSIIVIHDFFVPGKDFGYDVYNGKRLDLEYVLPALRLINPEFKFYYPSEVSGARRGWIIVYPPMIDSF